MNILLTNDDGIEADGLRCAYQALKSLGKVTVVAPDIERSSVGHGITLFHPLRATEVRNGRTLYGTAISGTPADCVKFAIRNVLHKKPDLVISGINAGANDGCSIFYSGTVAAAREAALLEIPAIAVSLAGSPPWNFRLGGTCLKRLVRMFKSLPFPQGTFLNVNIPSVPSSQVKGVRLTRQGTVPIQELFRERTDPQGKRYFWLTGRLPFIKKDDGSDTYALKNRYVTITPVHTDLTDYQFLGHLKTHFSENVSM